MTGGTKLVTYQIRLASLQWTYFLYGTTLSLWQQKENTQEQDNAEKLTQTISDIVKFMGKIRNNDFDEAATKQFVVLPILTALGWNYANIDTLEVFQNSELEVAKLTMLYRMKGNRWYLLSVSDGVPVSKWKNLKTR